MRTAIVTTLLIATLATVSHAALPAFNTSRVYSEAAFAAAIKPYTEAIAKNPNDANAHHWLGVAYLHGAFLFRFGAAPYARNYAPRAIASLERALALRPGYLASLISLIDAYSVAGDRVGWTRAMDRMIDANHSAALGILK